MSSLTPPAQEERPQHSPGVPQLPQFLRQATDLGTLGQGFVFHFTEPWRTLRIREQDTQLAKEIRVGQFGFFVSTIGPHTDRSDKLLEVLFGGNVRHSHKLWGALIYRAGEPAGLPLYEDPKRPGGTMWICPCPQNGFRHVNDYLLAIGAAVPRETGVQWAWWAS